MRERCLLVLLLCGCAPVENIEEVAQAAAAEPGNGPVLPGWTWMGLRWSDSVVPYVIDKNNSWPWPISCSNPPPSGPTLTSAQVQAINDSLDELRALTPVRFEAHDSSNPPPAGSPFLIYRASTTSGEDSIRGMPTGSCPNWIVFSVGTDAQDTRRIVLHETLHTLGFDHEQQRADRDFHVIFDDTCLAPSIKNSPTSETKLFGVDTAGLLITPYDYDSIMEYSSFNSCSGCNGGCTTPVLTKLDGTTFGTPAELSKHDINAISRMYERPLNSTEKADSSYGAAFATGDFDGDGYQDLAVGAPGQNAVYLYKGTGGSTTAQLGRLVAWKKLDFGNMPEGTVHTHQFGASLAAADFNGDGKDDLIVGAPGHSGETGAVYLYLQATVSLSPLRALTYTYRTDEEISTGSAGRKGDQFGFSLAAGDFDRDGVVDLAIGVPQKHVGGVRSGEVIVITPQKFAQMLTRLEPDMVPSGANIAGARFGAHLLAANLDPDDGPTVDLIVGSPESATTKVESGAVYLFRGSSSGITGKQLLRPSDRFDLGVGAIHFGTALAVGNFYGATTPGKNAERALAIGAPNHDFNNSKGSISRSGWVYLFRPSSTNVQLTQADRVEEASPAAFDHFGTALASSSDFLFGGSSDLLWVGTPGAGAGKVFMAAHDASGWGANSFLPYPTGGQQRIGAALIFGNFAPDSFGEPGTPELVAGAPGFSSDAGAFYLANFGQLREGLFAVDRFQQTSAHPE
jgi:Astacin (Peptidase family M12A)/FG-GAP repeat